MSSMKQKQIRKATLDDLNEVLLWVVKFFKESPWVDKVPFVLEDMESFVVNMITGDKTVIFLHDKGMIAGALFFPPFNYNYVISQEVMWFAEEDGGSLLEAFEQWSIQNGARMIDMSCIANEREDAVLRLFKRKGYNKMENHLVKEVA